MADKDVAGGGAPNEGKADGAATTKNATGTTVAQLDEMERLDKELEDLKVATMFNMVSFVRTCIRESDTEINCLFLTNAQAQKVKIKDMPQVRKQLGIKEPKMVIRLMPSHFGTSHRKTFKNYTDGAGNGRFPMKDVPELSYEHQEMTDHQMLLLARDVILPLAFKTHSLVIGCESCALTAAFVKVSAPLQRTLGNECPFHLLIFGRLYFYEVASRRPDSVARAVKEQTTAWDEKQSGPKMNQVIRDIFGDDEAFYPMEDLHTGKYSLIMFECAKQVVKNRRHIYMSATESFNNFTNDFITSLSKTLPVIALQTYGTNKMEAVPGLAEHVMRGLPALLLDSRVRGACRDLKEAERSLKAFSKSLHRDDNSGRTDQYFISAIACVKATLEHVLNKKDKQATSDVTDRALDVDEVVKDRDIYIWQAIEKRLQESDRKGSGSKPEERPDEDADEHPEDPGSSPSSESRAAISRRKEQAFKATNIIMSYVGEELEWESTTQVKRAEGAIRKLEGAATWEELKELLEENWCAIRGACFHKFSDVVAFQRKNSTWIKLDTETVGLKGSKVLRIVVPDLGERSLDFQECQEKLMKLIRKEMEFCKAYDRRSKTREAFSGNHDMWIAVYDIMMAESDVVRSASIWELKRVGRLLEAMAQTDRVPEKNTLQGLVLLRTAWNIFDAFNGSATFYKRLSRVSYGLMILVGLAMVSFTVLCNIFSGEIDAAVQRNTLIALALVASFATGFTAIIDPARKWMQLRNSAYHVESEIWRFRTRVGEYEGQASVATAHGRLDDERKAEQQLQLKLLQLQGHIRLSTGLQETAFYAKPMATNDVKLSEHKGNDQAPAAQVAVPLLGQTLLSQKPPPGAREEDAKLRRWHFQHHQYKCGHPDAVPHGGDSFHAPARPEDYIRWRLVPKMKFYQKRIPGYACKRRLFQVLLLACGLTTSLLAAIKKPHWTAIVAAVSSAVASTQEFLDLERKLQRYSAATHSLANILVAWQRLTEVDQANVGMITSLVEQTESVINEERNAWISEAQAAQQFARESAKEKEEKDEPGKKGSGSV